MWLPIRVVPQKKSCYRLVKVDVEVEVDQGDQVFWLKKSPNYPKIAYFGAQWCFITKNAVLGLLRFIKDLPTRAQMAANRRNWSHWRRRRLQDDPEREKSFKKSNRDVEKLLKEVRIAEKKTKERWDWRKIRMRKIKIAISYWRAAMMRNLKANKKTSNWWKVRRADERRRRRKTLQESKRRGENKGKWV